MDRERNCREGREVRRTSMAAGNGLTRRRPRTTTTSFRDSPEEDGAMEMQETTRLRDRGSSKNERDHRLSRNKRRRGYRFMHGTTNRDRVGDDTSDDSLDDDEEEDEDDEPGPIPVPVRMPPPSPNPNPNPSSSSITNHHHRKNSFPHVGTKVVRVAPWKVTDEMGFSVPKKARSASVKRSHECWVSGGGTGGSSGGGGEQLHRQSSTSPARPPPSVAVSLPAPASPSSSSVSHKKKLKPLGHKLKPPKVSKPSSVQDEIEIEVAEVLYGLMRQSSRQESTSSSQKLDSTRDLNGSSTDAKSRVSSPVSNSPSLAIQQSKLPQNPSSSTTPSSTIAPKRKRPRVLRQEEESSTTKIEDSSPKLEKSCGSTLENNGGTPTYPGSSQTSAIVSEPPRESAKAESSTNSDSKPLNEELEIRDGVRSKEGVSLPREESLSCGNKDVAAEKATAATKAISAAPDVVDNRREKSFKIDLMAPPLKSSQDGDGVIDFVSDAKAMVSNAEMKVEIGVKKEEKVNKTREHVSGETGMLGKKAGPVVNECELQKPSASQQGRLGLQIDLEKQNKDLKEPIATTSENKVQQLQKQQQQSRVPIESKPEKDVQSTSMPLPMTAAGWPGCGLTPLGCDVGQVRPQGVASLDGNPGPSNAIQQPQFVLNQPRPKRCTTHYYIARNIYYHQQFTRMNPFWPAAGAASIYGMKSPYNLNVLPPSEATIMGNPLQGNFVSRNMNSTQDKGLVEAVKDKGIMASNYMDATQKKQLVLQQAPPQMHAPAFIFHLSQQQAAAVAGNKSGSVKSQTTGNPSSSTTAQAAGAATTLSFNYQGLPSNDGQYLAILQNNGYPFPVGAPPHFRGATPSQAMPFLNGSFYPSQILHPSQFQQQQQLQSQSQQQAGQQGHQNGSTSSGSSSSQKHQQNQQQRLHGGGSSGSNAAGGNSNSLPGLKNRSTQPQSSSVPLNHQVRHFEADVVVEESPLTEDSRVSQGQKAAYNFSMQAQQKSLSAMSAALASSGTGNHGDKQQQSQHNSKGGPELISAQAFAMPFGPFNGAAAIPGFDMQNHVIFQNLPEAVRHGYPQMAAAVAAAQASQQQKRAHQYTGETKTVSDSNSVDDEKKAMTAKGTFNVGQGLVFSRADSTEQSTNLGSSVIESSAHTLNLISGPSNVNQTSRSSMSTGAVMAGASAPGNTSNSQQQQQQQPPQLIHLQKHQQQLHQHQQQQLQQQQQFHQHQLAAAAVARSKPSNTTSLSPYTDRLSTSSMTGKLPNSLSVFPQALVQGGSSAQWKNSSRTTVSSGSSPGPVSSTSSLKNHHSQQQQGRPQQGHTQISFGVNNLKQGPASHGQQIPSSNQSSSPPRSISKSAGGSPKTTSTGSKVGPAPALSSQQATKSSSSGPSRKSSPVGGMNAPSILGNSHVNSAPSSNAKPQSQQQQQQQQQQKQFQQAQLYFANPFMQAQSPQSTSNTTAASGASTIGYYQQWRPSEQLPQQGTSNASSGMISLSPSLTLAGVTTSDPTKAVAAAAANMKGGVLPPPGLLQASQFATQSGGHPFMSFPYIQSLPPQQVKPAEQKQPAGNDNLHACWQPEKR